MFKLLTYHRQETIKVAYRYNTSQCRDNEVSLRLDLQHRNDDTDYDDNPTEAASFTLHVNSGGVSTTVHLTHEGCAALVDLLTAELDNYDAWKQACGLPTAFTFPSKAHRASFKQAKVAEKALRLRSNDT
jgi:hypothetical protein